MGLVGSANRLGRKIVPGAAGVPVNEPLTSQTLTPISAKALPNWNFGHGSTGD